MLARLSARAHMRRMPLMCSLTAVSMLMVTAADAPPLPATGGFPPGMPPSHPLEDAPLAAPFAAVSGVIQAHVEMPNPSGDDTLPFRGRHAHCGDCPPPASAEQRPGPSWNGQELHAKHDAMQRLPRDPEVLAKALAERRKVATSLSFRQEL
jgi:hypothetical protein